jgi:hypothetical protein
MAWNRLGNETEWIRVGFGWGKFCPRIGTALITKLLATGVAGLRIEEEQVQLRKNREEGLY